MERRQLVPALGAAAIGPKLQLLAHVRSATPDADGRPQGAVGETLGEFRQQTADVHVQLILRARQPRIDGKRDALVGRVLRRKPTLLPGEREIIRNVRRLQSGVFEADEAAGWRQDRIRSADGRAQHDEAALGVDFEAG